jgi:hypothetical protein
MDNELEFSTPFKTAEDYLIRQAWTEIIIKCWEKDNDNYINELRVDPKKTLKGNGKIDESTERYFPITDEPPDELKELGEADLEKRLNEILKPFGQMMMGGGWTVNEGETWSRIIAQAWTDSVFLQNLRDDPKEALKGYPGISESPGKFFPISKERPKALENLSEDDLRKKLNDDDEPYMGWMRACCR